MYTAISPGSATAKQEAFILRLLNERVVSEPIRTSLVGRLAEGPRPDKGEASRMIDWLLAQPKPAPAADRPAPAQVEPGMYLVGGVVYKVTPARMSDRTFAKELTPDGFVYRGLASRFVSAADRMTLEQAAEYGRTHGHCIVCGRLLTDPESVEAGIGPVCATRF